MLSSGKYRPADIAIEPDWSAADFWYEIAALTAGWVTLKGLRAGSPQPDAVTAGLFERLGVLTDYTDEGAELSATPISSTVSTPTSPTPPDAVPSLVTTACLTRHAIPPHGSGRTPPQECDRLQAIIDEMRKVGAMLVTEEYDNVLVGRPAHARSRAPRVRYLRRPPHGNGPGARGGSYIRASWCATSRWSTSLIPDIGTPSAPPASPSPTNARDRRTMTVALILLAAIVVTGLACWLYELHARRREAAAPSDDPNPEASADEEEMLRHAHHVRARLLLAAVSSKIEYYDDEARRLRRPCPEAMPTTRLSSSATSSSPCVPTISPDGHAASSSGGITLPAPVRDELIMIVAEALGTTTRQWLTFFVSSTILSLSTPS